MQAKGWNTSAKKAFFLNALLTSIVGLWPLQDDTFFLKLRICLCLIEVIAASVTSAGKLIINCGDADDTLDAILVLVCGIMVTGKMLVLYIQRDHLIAIINSAVADWKSVKDERSTAIMMNHTQTCNRMAKLFYGAGMFSCTFYIMKTVIFTNFDMKDSDVLNVTESIVSRVYILPGGCIYDGYNEFVYYFVMINQVIQLIIMSAMNLGTDSMFVTVTTHLCGQFEMLKMQLMSVGKEADLQRNRESLKMIIMRHRHLMIIAEMLEETYNNIIFMQMLMSVVLISVEGVSLIMSMKYGNLLGVVKAIGVMQFMLLQSYIYTYPSDNLANQAEGLMRALYDSRWYELPASLMKDIVFIMMRINLPPYLTAGKFFYMTRGSYIDVIKTTASYLSVLRIMIE